MSTPLLCAWQLAVCDLWAPRGSLALADVEHVLTQRDERRSR